MLSSTNISNEKTTMPLSLSALTVEGSFSGYASVFNLPDMSRDVVWRGAFSESIKARGVKGIKLLYQHNPSQPIGYFTHISEDLRGLFVKGKILTDLNQGREILSLMRAGVLDGLSIGFRTVKGRTDPKTGFRHLTKIDLWEISIVTFPLLPAARVAQVKRLEV